MILLCYADLPVAMGLPVTRHPPHRFQRALLTHWAPASGNDTQEFGRPVAPGSDQAIWLIFIDYPPKSGCFQALDLHFHAPKWPYKMLLIPGARSFRYHQPPHALLP
jgi:hypothetical protein